MRTTALFLIVGLLSLAPARAVSAQTADDIVEKSLAAMGGREALARITSRVMTGRILVSRPGGDLPGTIVVMNETPNKSRTLITLDLSGLGAGAMQVENRFDGTSGIVLDSLRGDHEMTGDQLESLRNGIFPSPLLSYKERGTVITLAGKEKNGDGEAYSLTITPKSGPPTRLWLDAKTLLPARTTVTLDVPEVGKVEQTTELSDYRDVDGLKVPFHLKTTSPVQNFVVDFTKVEHNTKIDPALFAKPSGK